MCKSITVLENKRRFINLGLSNAEELDVNLFLFSIRNDWSFKRYLNEREELLEFIYNIPEYSASK